MYKILTSSHFEKFDRGDFFCSSYFFLCCFLFFVFVEFSQHGIYSWTANMRIWWICLCVHVHRASIHMQKSTLSYTTKTIASNVNRCKKNNRTLKELEKRAYNCNPLCVTRIQNSQPSMHIKWRVKILLGWKRFSTQRKRRSRVSERERKKKTRVYVSWMKNHHKMWAY